MQICKKAQQSYPYYAADGTLLYETVRIQYEDDSKSFRQRRPNSKGSWLYNLNGVEPVLYRLPQILSAALNNEVIYICEGEKDADALVTQGLCATTSPMGAGKWRPQYTAALAGATMAYVLPDNDKPGRAHALQVAASLDEAGIPVKIIDLCSLWPQLPHKGDVYDVICKMGEGVCTQLPEHAMPAADFVKLALRRDAAEEAPPYTFDTAAGYLQGSFMRELERNASGPVLSTGFAQLDKQLEGRLYPGLYVVGSISSLGKSAFCLQMADAIAAQGADVLFFTLEMSRLEMVGRSLTRQLFTDSGFNTGYSLGQLLHGGVGEGPLSAAIAAYTNAVGQNIAFIEGDFAMTVEDVAGIARQHQAVTGRRPIVFVDYIQILRPPDVRMTDKQAMDNNVVALKCLSRELETPVFAVSSFNRQSYSEQVNFSAFKESGAIEYSADFVLGLQARGIAAGSDALLDEKKAARMVAGETKTAKQKNPRPLEAVTLKNRRGAAWACFELDFYAKQNYFAETGR